jgi:hypothetical protein
VVVHLRNMSRLTEAAVDYSRPVCIPTLERGNEKLKHVILLDLKHVILRAVAGSTLRLMDSATTLRYAQNDNGGFATRRMTMGLCTV